MRHKREYIRHAVVLILAVAALIIAATAFSASCGVISAQANAPAWSYTGSLNAPRAGHHRDANTRQEGAGRRRLNALAAAGQPAELSDLTAEITPSSFPSLFIT